MASRELLSVKEVAEIMGVSPQAIYKRMGKDFKPYVVEVENKKWLKHSVLKRISNNHSTEKVECSAEVEALKKLVEILEKENDIKQATIDALNGKLDEEHRHLLELTAQVGSSLQVVTQTQLADRLIEGQQLLVEPSCEAGSGSPAATAKWKFWKK